MEPSVLGAVLAGGMSRRMGSDKGRLNVLGRPLAARAAEVLGQVFRNVVLVGGAHPAYQDLGLELVPDIHPGLGPLAGLHAALSHGAGRSVFVLACDLPLVSPALVRHVLDYPWPESEDEDKGRAPARAKVAFADGRLHPLCGLYAPGCREVVEKHLQLANLSLHDLLAAVETHAVPVTPELPFFREELLLNVNRPSDLEAARSLAAAYYRER